MSRRWVYIRWSLFLALCGAMALLQEYHTAGAEISFIQEKLQGERNVLLGQSLIDLSNDYVLMDISAHPDDEDGATLAFYRMKYGVKTYSVLFTRGEGGQNEKGSELYEELGVLRTEETKAAGRVLGAEVRFLNFPDFGYSKSATEAFQVWGGQMEALRRLVYVVRRYKPDVLFCNHNTVGGHGHHQAAALTALAAFDAAPDSTLFPDQLREDGVTLWQPKKLFFRVFGRTEITADVSNAVDTIDPLRTVAYLDIASEALRKHLTQGMDRANLRAFTRGRSLYRLVRSNSLYSQDSTSFFSGIDLWQDPALKPILPLKEEISRMASIRDRGSLLTSGARLQLLLNASRSTIIGASALAGRIMAQWGEKLGEVCRAASGSRVTISFKDSLLVPKQKVECEVRLSTERQANKAPEFTWSSPHGWRTEPVGAPRREGDRWTQQFTVRVSDTAVFSFPRAQYIYAPLELHANLTLATRVFTDGTPFTFTQDVAVDVAPAHILTVEPAALWASPAMVQEGIRFTYRLRNCQPHPTAGYVSVGVPNGWKADVAQFEIRDEDSLARGTLLVRSPALPLPGAYRLVFNGAGLPTNVLLTVADIKLVPGLSVGLVASYDNTLETALRQLGVRYTLLSDDQLTTENLSPYHTILLDIRAYLVRDGLKKQNSRLLDYVTRGGNLVVMYQRETEWKPEYAPYPFKLSRDRVTREDAPVLTLQPRHPLFTWPNPIRSDDWDGWKQERAVYMPVEVPEQYLQLLSTQDPDEAPLTTGYLTTAVGKGTYIYTSFVWYRQLKEWHVGALRCFVNMISYPLRKQ